MAHTSRQCLDNSQVLILLPPSEGKRRPLDGAICDLTTLSFASELTRTRTAQWRAQPAAVKRAATAPALDVYSGVLYAALDYSSLPAAARRRADSSIVIISALFGALRTTDNIPAYKAKMSTATWKTSLADALSPMSTTGVIVDCRSSTYASAFTPPPERTVIVRVFKHTGKTRTVITHMSKHHRGLLARLLCQSPRVAKTPVDIAHIASAQWECELNPPDGHGSWTLDLIVRDTAR